MKPSQKSAGIDNFLAALFGVDRQASIEAGKCVDAPAGCGGNAVELGFRNAITEREYTISGLCQNCQDSVFSE
jgi:hypothetical protein